MQELHQLELILRSVTSILAVVGLSYAVHDWRHWKDDETVRMSDRRKTYLPMFVLICFMTLAYSPVTFDRLLPWFNISELTKQSLRVVGMMCLFAYFFVAFVFRLRAYNLPRGIAYSKVASIFVGMVLTFAVAVYAA